jgi:hypothetical protein
VRVSARSKIVDRAEVLRWFEEGRPYPWMVAEYLRKYNIKTTVSMWSEFRSRNGLDRRNVQDHELMPWRLNPEHQMSYVAVMLRAEARRRAGAELAGDYLSRVTSWVSGLRERGVVIDYDPVDGFREVPRCDDDVDIIRAPRRSTGKRRARSEPRI